MSQSESPHPSVESSTDQEAADLRACFRLMNQALAKMEDVMTRRENRVREEMGRAMQSMEERVVSEIVRSVAERTELRIRRLEETVAQMERRLSSHTESAARQEGARDLEERMEALEGSLKRALDSVFPKVDSLVATLERRTSAVVPSCSCIPTSSTRTSTVKPPTSSRPPAPAARAVPSFSRETEEALLEAAKEGRVDGVRACLDAGAGINARDIESNTALHWAASRGHAGVVALLLRRGADLSVRDAGDRTALHDAAAGHSSGRCLSLLIDAGALVNCVGHYGLTPLHEAVSRNNEAAVRRLLAAGADRTAKDDDGETPLDYAVTDVVRSLLSSL